LRLLWISRHVVWSWRFFHYFKECYIQGIYSWLRVGNGRPLYEVFFHLMIVGRLIIIACCLSFLFYWLIQGCTLKSIAENVGYITAQSRPMLSIETGFSITNIKVIGSGQVYLGRLWRAFSRVIFSYTYMENIVLPQWWDHTMGKDQDHHLLVFLARIYTNYYANCYLCVNAGLHTTENINVVDLDPTLLQELSGFPDWQTERSSHSLAFTSLKEILGWLA
jgi:hypothetical protein